MRNSFNPLVIRDGSLIPVVQGGMDVSVFVSELSSAVVHEGNVGTTINVDLRRLHEDLLAESKINSNEEKYTHLNCIMLNRGIKRAKTDSEDKDMIAINIIKAVGGHAAYIRQVCGSDADAIVMNTGSSLDLLEMAEGCRKDVALFPILSESRGINIALKHWTREGISPGAIVIKHPAHTAGHLDMATVDGVNNTKFELKRAVKGVSEVFKDLGLESEKVPLILTGDMADFKKVKATLKN